MALLQRRNIAAAWSLDLELLAASRALGDRTFYRYRYDYRWMDRGDARDGRAQTASLISIVRSEKNGWLTEERAALGQLVEKEESLAAVVTNLIIEWSARRIIG